MTPAKSIDEQLMMNSVAIAMVGMKFIRRRNLTIPVMFNLSFFMTNPPQIIPITAAGINTNPARCKIYVMYGCKITVQAMSKIQYMRSNQLNIKI